MSFTNLEWGGIVYKLCNIVDYFNEMNWKQEAEMVKSSKRNYSTSLYKKRN